MQDPQESRFTPAKLSCTEEWERSRLSSNLPVGGKSLCRTGMHLDCRRACMGPCKQPGHDISWYPDGRMSMDTWLGVVKRLCSSIWSERILSAMACLSMIWCIFQPQTIEYAIHGILYKECFKSLVIPRQCLPWNGNWSGRWEDITSPPCLNTNVRDMVKEYMPMVKTVPKQNLQEDSNSAGTCVGKGQYSRHSSLWPCGPKEVLLFRCAKAQCASTRNRCNTSYATASAHHRIVELDSSLPFQGLLWAQHKPHIWIVNCETWYSRQEPTLAWPTPLNVRNLDLHVQVPWQSSLSGWILAVLLLHWQPDSLEWEQYESEVSSIVHCNPSHDSFWSALAHSSAHHTGRIII